MREIPDRQESTRELDAQLSGIRLAERAGALPEADVSRTAASRFRGFLKTLRDAVRGSSLDYTTAPIGRAIF
ncbi:MAG TPA: hypothetical protein VFT63_06640, partial [bacterium]|nr:hypothetical protein [bacterium]